MDIVSFLIFIMAFVIGCIVGFNKGKTPEPIDGRLLVVNDPDETYMFLELDNQELVVNRRKKYVKLRINRLTQK